MAKKKRGGVTKNSTGVRENAAAPSDAEIQIGEQHSATFEENVGIDASDSGENPPSQSKTLERKEPNASDKTEASLSHESEGKIPNEEFPQGNSTEGLEQIKQCENTASEPVEDEDDFGSFDDASFEELPDDHVINEYHIKQEVLTKQSNLPEILDLLFPPKNNNKELPDNPLLNDVALNRLEVFSKTPRLNPPNWTQSKLRQSLLQILGVPINLDELTTSGKFSSTHETSVLRRGSITEEDLDWSRFHIPTPEDINLSHEKQNELIANSHEHLSRIEEENLSNVSELFLHGCSEEVLDAKLEQTQKNYELLLQMSTVWTGEIRELRKNQDIFESVLQDVVGHSQKIQRNELMERLGRSKSRRGKRAF